MPGWDGFKLQIKATMESYPLDYDVLPRRLAVAYDMAMKSPPAGDLIAGNPVLAGNVVGMELVFKSVFLQQATSPDQLDLIKLLGNGFVTYWTGATLAPMKPLALAPPLATPPSLAVLSILCTNPGTTAQIPTFVYKGEPNVDTFINNFITAADLHLRTVSGIFNVTALYGTPPTAIASPGIVNWVGFSTNSSEAAIANQIAFDTAFLALGLGNRPDLLGNAEGNAQAIVDAYNAANGGFGEGGANAYGGNQDANLEEIRKAAIKFGITNPQMIIAMQANALKETGGRVIVENVNYTKNSRARLEEIFGKRIRRLSDAELAQIQTSPETFANYIYGTKGNSLGNTQPGDGYKFRGRGFIQITGRANYTAVSRALYGDDRLVTNPDLLNNPTAAAEATAWFVNRSLSNFARKMNLNPKDITQENATHLVTSIVAGSVIDRGGTGFLTTTALRKANSYAAQLSSRNAGNTNLLASNTNTQTRTTTGG
jgi:predicted chitinase